MRCWRHFFFPMQGKNSGKFLWPGLPSDLINPSWDSEASTAYSIPSGQDKSRHSVTLPLLNGWSTLYSPRSQVVQNWDLLLSTPFCFSHRISPPKTRHSRGLCSVGSCTESWELWCMLALQQKVLLPRASSSHLTSEVIPSDAAEYSYWNVMGHKQEMRIIQSHPSASTQA